VRIRRLVRVAAKITVALLVTLALLRPAWADSSTPTYIVSPFGDLEFYFNADLNSPHDTTMIISRVYNSFDNEKTGIFGTGWGSLFEEHLKLQDDDSIIIYEYGGGAHNRFTPTTSSLRPQQQIRDEIMRAAEQIGQLGSDADRAAYQHMLEDSDAEETTWENLTRMGLLKSQQPAVGETFFSGRFATEIVTRVPEGYQRATSKNGHNFFEAFDLSGRLTRVWDPNHDYITLSYHGDQLQTMADNKGNQFTFSFTPGGLVSAVKDSRGHTVRYQYKNSDLISADVNGKVTRYEYDAEQRLVAIRFPEHTSMQLGYNSAGLVNLVKDPAGTVATYTYASHATPTERVDSVDSTTRKATGGTQRKSEQYFYAAPDYYLIQQIESLDGVATTSTFDRDRDVLTLTTVGGTTHYTYDNLDRLVLKQTPTGTTYKTEYDPATGKVSAITRTDKASVFTEHFQYDPKGNLARAYDSDGHDFAIERDPNGRIAAVSGSTLQLSFAYADTRASNPATVALAGIGSVTISYLDDGSVASAKSDGGTVVVAKVRAALKTVNDLISDAGADVIALPTKAST
jgi:YD repeat-containing protein